jgi:hypothetical protein
VTSRARIAGSHGGVACVRGLALTTSNAGPLAELSVAIDAITDLETERMTAGVDDGRRRLEIRLDKAGSGEPPCALLRGRATTRDGNEKTGSDPRGLQPARAIRRALADAGVKASGTNAVYACYSDSSFADARGRAMASISLAFGPYANGVAVHLHRSLGDGRMSAALASARCIRAIADERIGLGVAITIGVNGENSALVFSRA